jgi:hypothetical protein
MTTGSATVMARCDESAWSNDDGRKFNKTTKVQGMMTYELHVSIKLPKYRTQKAVKARRSDERLSTAATDDAALASNSRSCTAGTELPGLCVLYASQAATAAPAAKKTHHENEGGQQQHWAACKSRGTLFSTPASTWQVA